MKRFNTSVFRKWLLALSLVLCLVQSGCSSENALHRNNAVFSVISSVFGHDDELRLHMFDVGQADAALVQYKGKNILIDTGHIDSRKKLVKLLKDRDVETLDAVLVSHPHSDHLGGMSALVDHFTVRQVYDNGEETDDAMYKLYIKKLGEQNVPRKAVRKGDVISFADDVVLHVLWPAGTARRDRGSSTENSSENNRSVICRMTYNNFSVMFTGDAEEEAEKSVLKLYRPDDLRAVVLKVSHHGSKTAADPEFVAAVRPREALISCGTGNTYDFPHEQTLAVLAQYGAAVRRTDRNGNIVIRSNGHTYTVSSER